MNKYSNILIVPTHFDYYKTFMAKLVSTYDPDNKIPLYGVNNKENLLFEEKYPYIIKTTENTKDYQTRTIKTIAKTDNKFLISLNVVSLNPSSADSLILALCRNCKIR